MKIFSADIIHEADAYTIINEPIASIDLLERAATQIFNWFQKNVSTDKKIQIFTGLGNSGGDGLALVEEILGERSIVHHRGISRIRSLCQMSQLKVKRL